MKTITFKKTLNNNYIACILPIIGQQSGEDYVYVFDSNLDFVKIDRVHPMFSYVKHCETIATIGGLENETEVIYIALKKIIENNFKGYTTAYNVENNKFMPLLPPVNSI